MLVDFGLAKRAPSDQRLFTVCGSIEYMAPEVTLPSYHPLGLGSIEYMAPEVISYPSNPNPNL